MTKFMWLVYFAKMTLCPCINERKEGVKVIGLQANIQKLGEFATEINENSGLLFLEKDRLLTHNDSGGEPALYETTLNGQSINKRLIPNVKNLDWEDLAFDRKNNIIYIADTGNNGLRREETNIYRVDSLSTESIKIQFENGPKDIEAMYYANDSLHLFSKSINTKTPISYYYAVPADKKEYITKPQETVNLHGLVTGADISFDQETLALITYGKVLIFKKNAGSFDLNHPSYCIKTKRKQTEAITFISNKKIVFSNEQRKLYSLELPLK